MWDCLIQIGIILFAIADAHGSLQGGHRPLGWESFAHPAAPRATGRVSRMMKTKRPPARSDSMLNL
eukprot:2404017-Pyramimonas_sp.AAC.1